VRSGVHGTHPRLESVPRGDLPFTCDFRRVYAAILRDWLNVEPSRILGAGHAPLPLISPT
jgi:uncharacterized protein (DUF1501 family)